MKDTVELHYGHSWTLGLISQDMSDSVASVLAITFLFIHSDFCKAPNIICLEVKRQNTGMSLFIYRP